MIRYILYITAGYLLFKVVKNGVYLVIENIQKPKELKGTTELRQCDQCGGFFNETTLFNHNGKSFCSEKCKTEFLNDQ